MADVNLLIEAIQNNLNTIKATLGEDAAEFEKQYVACSDAALSSGDEQVRRQTVSRFSELMGSFPAALDALPEDARMLFTEAAPDRSPPNDQIALHPPPPITEAPRVIANGTNNTANNRTSAPMEQIREETHMATTTPDSGSGSDTLAKANTSGITFEQRLQLIKERVTAVIGLALVALTIAIFTYIVFFGLKDATQLASAKDIITMVLPLTGVVLGYYFGRVPADAHAASADAKADNATTQAEQAKAQTEQVKAQADKAADALDDLATKHAERGSEEDGGKSLEETQVAQDQAISGMRDVARQLRGISRIR